MPIPDFVDIWFLDREAEPTDRTAMETVIDTVREEKAPPPVGKGSAAGVVLGEGLVLGGRGGSVEGGVGAGRDGRSWPVAAAALR